MFNREIMVSRFFQGAEGCVAETTPRSLGEVDQFWRKKAIIEERPLIVGEPHPPSPFHQPH